MRVTDSGRRGTKERREPRPAPSPNYFAWAEVAARYKQARPFFQAEVAERVRSFAGAERFRRALDVGCGAGQSAIALASVADAVAAIDASPAMLEQAEAHARVRYRLGVAERLEFADGEFDLVSAGSSLHWFDQERFYGECRRVLAPSGLLLVYNDHFTTHMQGEVECKRWMRTRFAKRYPPPRRGMRDIDEQRAAECGFRVAHRDNFSHLAAWGRHELVAYLLTRSNTLAAMERGESQSEMMEWLEREIAPIVPDGLTGQFIFKCNLWLMRAA